MNSREYFPTKADGSSPQATKTSKRLFNGGVKRFYKQKDAVKHHHQYRQYEPKQASYNNFGNHSDDTLDSSTENRSPPQSKTSSAIAINSDVSEQKIILESGCCSSKFSEFQQQEVCNKLNNFNMNKKEHDDIMEFHVADNKSDGGQTAMSSTDYHTACGNSEMCQEDVSNNLTTDHTMDNTDSMSETHKSCSDHNCTHQESFMNSSRRNSICEDSIDIDIQNVDVSQITKTSGMESFNLPMKQLSMNSISFKPSTFVPGAKKSQNALPQKKAVQPAPVVPAAPASKTDYGLDSLSLSTDFTPSTPYVHKFRTEMCKNWSLYGKCKYGDECSFAHTKNHMMIKTDVSVLYKTKLCKKYSTNGYCPYGMRCQFIHDLSEAPSQEQQQQPVAVVQPETSVVELEKSKVEMNVNCTSFTIGNSVQAAQIKAKKIQIAKQGPVVSATGTGGFGNKQASHAFAQKKIIYRDILVHCVHNSVQEYQKKMKMFQKKVNKKKYLDCVQQPEINYMNIYTQQCSRLNVFQNITNQKAFLQDVQDETYQEGGYFYGDATAYEQQLDRVLKQLSTGTVPQNCGIIYSNAQTDQTQPIYQYQNDFHQYFQQQPSAPQIYMGGYQTNFNLGSSVFVPNAQESVIEEQHSMKMNSQEFVPTIPKTTAMFQPLPKMNSKPFIPTTEVTTINDSTLNLAEQDLFAQLKTLSSR